MLSRANVATFGLYLLAYAHAYPEAEYFLLGYGEPDAGTGVVNSLASRLGVTPITAEAAMAHDFDVVLTHSYVDTDVVSEILSGISFDQTWYYADLIRNGFIWPPQTDLSKSTLVFFGWELVDEVWALELAAPPRDVHVVALDSIRTLWSMVVEHAPGVLDVPPATDGSTLLIAMRYWGNTSVYQTRRAQSVIDAVADLELPSTVSRVVVKHDPRSIVPDCEVEDALRERLDPRVAVVPWTPDEAIHVALGSLDVLDLYLFAGDWLKGHFFGFDGTPNVLVGVTQSQVDVLWPRNERLRDYFIDPLAVSQVMETVEWQRNVVEQYRSSGATSITTTYSGQYFRALFTQNLRVDGALERGLLKASIDRIADSVGLGPDPILFELAVRVAGQRNDRLRYEHLWQVSRQSNESSALSDTSTTALAVAEAVAQAAAREEAHLAEAVAQAAAREEAHVAEAVAQAAAREEAHLAEAVAQAAAREEVLLARIEALESELSSARRPRFPRLMRPRS